MPKKKTIKYPKDPATKYALSVVAGKTIAGPHVRDACKRHLDDLQTGHKRDLEWDIKEVSRVVTFFKEICTVEKEIENKSEGGNEWAAVPFILEPSQAFIVGSIFGWKRKGIRRFRRAYIEQGKGSGKALAIDTPIPTPDGFKNMGDIVPGDQVFSDDGSVCNVTAVSGIMYNRLCYRLTFSDGSEIVADEDHLWRIYPYAQINSRDKGISVLGKILMPTKKISESTYHCYVDWRRVTACIPVRSVPVQCISVDSKSNMFLAGRNYIPTHNSPLAAAIGHYMLVA